MGIPILGPEGEIIGFNPRPETLSIITDDADVVVDIASRKENLSRGKEVTNFRQYNDIDDLYDIRIGDSFDGEKLTRDMDVRQAEAERAANESKVQTEMRRAAVQSLKDKAELPPDYE